MKKLLYILIINLSLFLSAFWAWPKIIENWLPFDGVTTDKIVWTVFWWIVAEFIKYVAVIAVISIMISGVMYLVSWGEEEKVKRAKTWIIWSLVWVFLSVSAWAIINIVNVFKIW